MGAHRSDDDTPMSLRKGTQNQINGPYRYETSGDRTFHPLMQFLKNDVFDDFIGCLIV